MSTTPTSTSGGISSSGSGSPVQLTGLSSGLNSSAIIQATLAARQAPLKVMQSEITGLNTMNATLGALKSSLMTVMLDAKLLGAPSTFFQTQSITSSNSTLVSAQTSNGPGVPIGSTAVAVTQLAGAAQTTFNYTPPTAGPDTLTISDGVNPAQSITVAANTSISSLAQQINGSSTVGVWAAVSASGQLVLSSRATGSKYLVSATDTTTAGNLTSVSAQAGLDAKYTINGTAGTSSSNTVTGAIPGVTLNLQGITGATPVTITAAAPGPNTAAITQQVQQFVTDYNAAMTALQAAVNTKPAAGATFDPNSGSLFNDPSLQSLITKLRTAMMAPGSGLPAGMSSMTDLGVTTGRSTGTPTQAGATGTLTFDPTVLANALAKNPSGVQQVLQKWSQSMTSVLSTQTGVGGGLAARISGNTTLAATLQRQYTVLSKSIAQQQATMEAQWAKLEATMSTLKAQGTYLNQVSYTPSR